ncbi:hypothetical protein GCM10029978_061810 [Actinoallomurus acanthiterrae]
MTFLDTTGVRKAVQGLGHLTDPAGTAASLRDTFAGTDSMRSYFKEILGGQCTTENAFESRLTRDRLGAIDIRGHLGPTSFAGASAHKAVTGIIKLQLMEGRATGTSSHGWTWEQLDVALGGDAGPAHLTGETDLNRHWQFNRSRTSGRTGGKELLQLDFNRVYFFRSTVSFDVRSRLEKHAKLLPSGSAHHTETVGPRLVEFALPEPEALAQYADGHLPISDRQLRNAMLRWHIGKLKLGGDLAAKILMRWQSEVPTLPKDARVGRDKLARTLVRLHETGAAPILDEWVRDRFNTAFGRRLGAPHDPFTAPDMPEDVVAYAEDRAPLTDQRLGEVLRGWLDGDLRLSGDVVARLLMRWHAEVPEPPAGLPVNRPPLVGVLAGLHTVGAVPITSLEVRDRFNATFRQKLSHPRLPFDRMTLPEYLTRTDPGGFFLGHHGVHRWTHDDGRTTEQIVRQQIDRVAPGLLGADPSLWDGKGRRIGRMQGGVDLLQAILAEGRDQMLWEELPSQNGFTFYLANPVGPVLTDVVRVRMRAERISEPEVHDYRWNTGLAVYSHGYVGTAQSRSRDGAQALVLPKFSAGGTNASGSADIKTAEGHHRGTTRAENAVSEMTDYDWANHYAVRVRQRLIVEVDRLDMSGRPLDNLLLGGLDRWTRHSATARTTADGTLDIQLPHALAEAGTLHGPEQVRNLLPLPKLNRNLAVVGMTADGLLPAARKLLDTLLGPRWYEKALGAEAGDPGVRSFQSLPFLLSRSHLVNHVLEATGGGEYRLPPDLFRAGDSDLRAAMSLRGELFDAQVVIRMVDGSGVGRYIKHQSGTTANNSSDLTRGTGDYGIGGTDTFNPQPGTEAAPHRPDHSWSLNHGGSRVTSANDNSAGTENYRREQDVKEYGSKLLVRLRGQFWLEAQKMRHHLVTPNKPKPVGAPVRSDPITGDVVVEMFEAQYEELRAELAANERQARQALRDRVDPKAWAGLGTAPRFDLAPLLADAAVYRPDPTHPQPGPRPKYAASQAHHALVSHLREQGGARGPVVLTHGANTRILHYRAILDWAARTIRDDLAAARAADPYVPAPAVPDVYEQRRARPDTRLLDGLTGSLDDEITAIINEVNRVHALRPDNPTGAPAALPPEAALLSLDPVHLARDVARELSTHVRLDVAQPDGTVRSHWADPSGRLYAFDPSTFDDLALTADQASNAGLWSDGTRRIAADHGLDPIDLARLYRTSWSHQRTFEQAVLAEVAGRLDRMDTAHAELPGMFGRTAQAAAAWRGIVARIEAEHAAAAAETTRAQRELDDLQLALDDLYTQRTRLILDVSPDPAALDGLRDRISDLEARQAEQEELLERHEESTAYLTPLLADARHGLQGTEEILADLRVTGRGAGAGEAARWTADAVQETADRLTASESALDERRVNLAYRRRQAPSIEQAIQGLHDTLSAAGDGAVSLAVTTRADGTAERFTVVADRGEIRWFEAVSGLPVRPPESGGRLYSLDLGGDGLLLDPPAGLDGARSQVRSFTSVRDLALASVVDHLGAGLAGQVARRTEVQSRPTLDQALLAFENRLVDRSASIAALTDTPRPPIVSLDTARRGGVPDDAYVYRNERGRHGIGPADAEVPGWTPLGPLADFVPVFWLTHGAPARPTTVQDVARGGLGAAVRFLAEAGDRTWEEDVLRAIEERPDRLAEEVDRIPDDLPPGTWIWFIGPSRMGAVAVVTDPAGATRYRVLLAGSAAPREARDRIALAPLDNGRHTLVVSRPRAAAQPRPAPGLSMTDPVPRTSRTAPVAGRSDTRTVGESEIEQAAARALKAEAEAFDQARLDAALSARRLRPIDVPADDNCFYHSLLAIAGPYLAREIPGLRSIRPGSREAVQVVRNWLADRLEADLAVADEGLLSRYAGFFHESGDGTSFADWSRALVNQIRRMDSWRNETGDLVAHLAANELGLPVTLVQDRHVTQLGPAGGARVHFIRTPGHFRGAESTDEDAPQIPWDRLRPAPPTPADRSARQFALLRGSSERRVERAGTDYRDLREHLDPDARPAVDAQAREIVDRFWNAHAAGGHVDVPPHRRAQHRLDGMRRAAADLEGLIRNLRGQLGDPPASEPPNQGVRAGHPRVGPPRERGQLPAGPPRRRMARRPGRPRGGRTGAARHPAGRPHGPSRTGHRPRPSDRPR